MLYVYQQFYLCVWSETGPCVSACVIMLNGYSYSAVQRCYAQLLCCNWHIMNTKKHLLAIRSLGNITLCVCVYVQKISCVFEKEVIITHLHVKD